MVYPASIVGVAFLVIVFMLRFVIPTFAAIFKDMGADLPVPTRIVIWLSEFVRSYILLIFAAIGGAIFAMRSYYRTENGKATIDALLRPRCTRCAVPAARAPMPARRRRPRRDARGRRGLGRSGARALC